MSVKDYASFRLSCFECNLNLGNLARSYYIQLSRGKSPKDIFDLFGMSEHRVCCRRAFLSHSPPAAQEHIPSVPWPTARIRRQLQYWKHSVLENDSLKSHFLFALPFVVHQNDPMCQVLWIGMSDADPVEKHALAEGTLGIGDLSSDGGKVDIQISAESEIEPRRMDVDTAVIVIVYHIAKADLSELLTKLLETKWPESVKTQIKDLWSVVEKHIKKLTSACARSNSIIDETEETEIYLDDKEYFANLLCSYRDTEMITQARRLFSMCEKVLSDKGDVE